MKQQGEILSSYIINESINNCSEDVISSVKDALADIIASTISGSQTEVASIVRKFVNSQWGTGKSTVLMFRDKVSASGAALVNAFMANALDVDDGHRLTKGHPGAIIFPSVLAAAEEIEATGEEFLTSLLIGYEVGIRAGILAHDLRPEYHCTGSWGAIGAAAGVCKILKFNKEEIEHALGIAEYNSTYSPMMRCIDEPSMLKDGIGWGSLTGVSAAYLAKEGFTGIPSLFSYDLAKPYIQELGHHYRIKELYYKPYACCRWAQPAVDCVKEILTKYLISYEQIERIKIHTFTESSKLSKNYPKNTEEAQYNLYFPIASYILFGEVGPKQVLKELDNHNIHLLMDKMETVIEKKFDEAFPQKTKSQVEIYTNDGKCFRSSILQAKGDYDYPLTKDEKKNKFLWLTEPLLGTSVSLELYEMINKIQELKSIKELITLIHS
jgi:2-methylcitrate dehydratase PrpD